MTGLDNSFLDTGKAHARPALSGGAPDISREPKSREAAWLEGNSSKETNKLSQSEMKAQLMSCRSL